MEILGHRKWKILRDHHHGFAEVTPVHFGAALSGVRWAMRLRRCSRHRAGLRSAATTATETAVAP